MYIYQLSVFLENRKGRMEEVANILKNNNINIISVSLADTNEYGLLRLIVSDPDEAQKVLKDNGFSSMLTKVLAVKLKYQVGTLQSLLKILSDANINIEYMYALATGEENGSMIIKASDLECAANSLISNGMSLYTKDEVYGVNGII